MNFKNRQQMLVVMVVTGFALLASDKILITPLMKSYDARNLEIAKLRKEVANGNALIRMEKAIRKDWGKKRASTLPTIPSAAESQMLKQFDSWAQETGITLSSIKPQWKNSSDEFMTLECRADGSGTLYTVAQFVYMVESDPLALKIESLELTSREGDGRNISISIQVSGLLLVPQSAEARKL